MQRSQQKEKVVQVYEKFFSGQDITQGRANFWDEFFLLKVNINVLLTYFDRLSQEQLINLKPHLNRLFGECIIQVVKASHWLRVANALQTADCLLLGALEGKNCSLPSEERLNLLLAKEQIPAFKTNYVDICSASFNNGWPLLLHEVFLNSLTLLSVASNNLNENPLLEYLLDENLFELLGTLISSPALRWQFGATACRLLALIAQYHRKDLTNPFLLKLAEVKDEILLNSISAIISFALSDSTRKFSEQMQSSFGILTSISNLLGNLKVGDGQRQSLDLHDGLLLCLYMIVLNNPRFPALLTCSHTHVKPLAQKSPSPPSITSPLEVSIKSLDKNGQLNETEPEGENQVPSLLALEPRNLLADLIEYTSIVMLDIRDPSTMNTCNLSFKILSHISKHPSACCFLHEYNIHFTIHLHKARLRHRKVSALLQDRSSSNTMAAVLLDLVVEFFCTHIMKSFPFEIHGHCLDICYHLLAHQKEHSIRLDYNWRQLWKALFDLTRFIVKPGGPNVCTESFILLQKIIGIFNFFVTFGDCFLQGPDTYDELYYELVRMSSVIESLYEFAKQHSISSELSWEFMACDLVSEVGNLRVIVKHFEAKIAGYLNANNCTTLTELQVYDVIRDNYDALTLQIYDELYLHYKRPLKNAVQSNEETLFGLVQHVRKTCLKSSIAFQSRFSELSVIL